MTSLNDVNFGLNQYCGPAVLSILTGRSTDECARVIGQINGKKEIKAVQVEDLIKSVSRLGFDAKPVALYSGSLFGVINHLAALGDAKYIVGVPRHVVIIEVKEGQVYFCDNQTKNPINAAASSRLMQRVDSVYLVVPTPIPPEPKIIRSELRVERKFSRIDVARYDIYDNNTVAKDHVSSGTIYFKNNADLRELLDRLTAVIYGSKADDNSI